MSGRGVRLAVDIGGTFTDLVAHDPAGGVVRAKAGSTPGGLERGALAALDQSAVPPAGISVFVHGTTVVVSTVTERTGALRLEAPLEVVSLRVTATAEAAPPIAWPSDDGAAVGLPPGQVARRDDLGNLVIEEGR